MTERADRRLRLVILAVVAAIVIGPLVTYAVDEIWVRYRLALNRANDPLDTVTLYVATKLKNGQLEIFYNLPVIEVCVRAVFPHLGHRPCWYVRRSPLKLVAAAGESIAPHPPLARSRRSS